MGRGQQIIICDVEKSVNTTFGKDFRSVNKGKLLLLAILAVFLPFLIASSYMYYMTPDASTEAMMSFQRRPSSSNLPLEEGTDTSEFGNVANGSDIEETENTTRSVGTVADAVAEDMEAQKVGLSETDIPAIETNATLGFPELKNATSPDVNASTIESSVSRQIFPDGSSSNQESEHPSVLGMEGEGLSNSTDVGNKGVCDLFRGRWVPEPLGPRYTNATCRFIQSHQNCMTNGRPDRGFMYWKWQPEQCDLPRLDGRAFLTAMRNRSMTFVGDSIARNQFQSLLCLLAQIEVPEYTYRPPDDKDNVLVFPSYNFTFAIYWSSYLVHAEDKQVTRADNRTETVAHIHIDQIDEAWARRVSGVDFLIISTGPWWLKRALYLESGQLVGGHGCEGWAECTKEIGFVHPYRKAMNTWLRGGLSIPGFSGIATLRTYSPSHFEGGEWHSGGKCVRTDPGGVPTSDITKLLYDSQFNTFQNITGALSASGKHRMRLLDITYLSQIRADGHADVYMQFQPFSKQQTKQQHIQSDCLHWCLPGPIDTWNDLLVELLRDAVFR